MLNKFEIDQYFYKANKHLIKPEYNSVSLNEDVGLKLLFDNNCNLIAISKHTSTVKALATFNKKYCPRFIDPKQENSFLDKNQCWKYKLDFNQKQYVKNNEIGSIEELQDLILVNQKAECLDIIQEHIDGVLKQNVIEDTTQQYIYFSKYLESKEILKNNIFEDNNAEFPFISSLAKIYEVTLQQAAKGFKLEHEVYSDYLCEFETIRLKYTKKILEEKELSNLKTVLEQFNVEFGKYSDI